MIEHIPSESRYHASHGWLSSYHLFSFAEYFNPNNMHFGALRVVNDDTIDAHSGFGAHSHKDMEIVTIVLSGALTHRDSLGNEGTISEGEVQYMSAGTGVTHSEFNEGDVPVHLYQIWIMPTSKNLTPSYAQETLIPRANAFTPVASNGEGGIKIEADATIYKGMIESGESMNYPLKEGKGLFIYVTTGVLRINDLRLTEGDQARIVEESVLVITAEEATEFLAIETKI